MMSRRDRFREQIRRLEATGSGDRAFTEGWLRARPGAALARQIAAPLDLKDGVALALIGGIGSGKTTELLRVREILKESEPDRLVVYLDVGQKASLAGLKKQALIGVVGHAMALELEGRGVVAAGEYSKLFERLTWGYNRDVRYDSTSDFYEEKIDGVAERPPSPHGELGELLERLVKTTPAELAPLVLVDGLDRLIDLQAWLALRDDIATISGLGIGALYVSPVSFRLNPAQRDLTLIFDEAIDFPYVDVERSQVASEFLVDVLRARSVDVMLSVEVCTSLAGHSGGALRDLLQLAQLATQDSYSRGLDAVDVASVRVAADRLGRKLLLGVGEDQLATLQSLRRGHQFALTTDATTALVVGSLVLFYEGPRFAVHPCVSPILAQLAGEDPSDVF